jgi:hypothetical protein
MSLRAHLRRVFSFAGRSQSSRLPRHSRPALEALEDRLALSLASSVSGIGGIHDFYIDSGTLYLYDAKHPVGSPSIWPQQAGNVKSVSAVQDPDGNVRAAVLLKNGSLYDYAVWKNSFEFEGSNIQQASAGPGFDAVLYGGGGGLVGYIDPVSATVKAFVAFGATQISAGTDRDTLPMIAYVDNQHNAYEWRLGTTTGSGYTESLGVGYNQVSAGRNGVVALLGVSWLGTAAYNHYDDPYASVGGAFTTAGTTKWLDGGFGVWITEVSAGTDAKGMAMTDVLFSGTGQVKEHSDACGVKDLGKGWLEVDAGLGGISDLVEQTPGWPSGVHNIWRFQDGCDTKPDQWTGLSYHYIG